MKNDNNIALSKTDETILRRVCVLEKSNYSKKPEGLTNKEIVERIKKIIEEEVDKK